MPYIKGEDRYKFGQGITWLQPSNAGELNYVFTMIIKRYMNLKGEKYQHYNDVIGALEGAKLELYRRKILPYEDSKIKNNGDVY